MAGVTRGRLTLDSRKACVYNYRPAIPRGMPPVIFAMSRPPSGISLLLGAALMTSVGAAPARAAERESKACLAFATSLEAAKPDTQLQRNIALFAAAGKDCVEIAKRLIAAGASVEAANRFGTTALGQAAREGHLDMVDLLLAHGAEINARNVGGATPLYIAADSDRTAVVHRLLAKGADPNLARNNGLTPLTAAAYNGNADIVADLLAHHANPNRPDNTEKTAILYAAAKGFTPVVQLLLKAGVDPKAAYGNRLTALMWAAGYADGAGIDDAQNVAKLLIDHGALLDAADNRGRTALMIAAETGHLEMVDLLLKRGADRELRDKRAKARSTWPPTRRSRRAAERSARVPGAAQHVVMRCRLGTVPPARNGPDQRASRFRSCCAAPGHASQPGEILRHGGDLLLRGRLHQIGHAGIVAARAVAESQHLAFQIFAPLTGQARLGSRALIIALVAAGAADGGVGPLRLGDDIGGRRRLVELRPLLLGKIFGQRHHVVAAERLRHRRHHRVLARPALEVAQLQIEIAVLLAPDHRNVLVNRHAVSAVTGGADLRLRRDILGRVLRARPAGRGSDHESGNAKCFQQRQGTANISDEILQNMKRDGARRSPVSLSHRAARMARCLPAQLVTGSVKAMMLLPRL